MPFQAALCGGWEPEGANSLFLANNSLRAVVEAVQAASSIWPNESKGVLKAGGLLVEVADLR